MYWLLNSIPLVIGLLWEIYAFFGVFSKYNSVTNALMWIGVLILMPLYLLSINIIHLNKHTVTYTTGIICMLGVIVARVLMGLVFHKIKYGEFIGDVPVGIYHFLVIVPSVIVLIGIAIYYFVKVRIS